MRRLLTVMFFLLLLTVLLAQQAPPPGKTSTPSNVQTVHVRGCIKGRQIRDVVGSIGAAGQTYRLNGSKSILAVLKEHNGHEDDITGTMKIADSKTYTVGKEKQFGKTRVYGGASGSDRDDGFQKVEDPAIDVSEIAHLDRKCVVNKD